MMKDIESEDIIHHNDHDTLIELVRMMKYQIETDKEIARNLKEHQSNDDNNFNNIRKDILGLQKIVWTATGIIIALDALPKLIEVVKTLK
jgi:hypothetical protein